MSITTQSRPSRRRPLAQDPSPIRTRPASTRQRLLLQAELTKQRMVLLTHTQISLFADKESETQADPVDQASVELEHNLAIQVRIRTFDQLCNIDRALQLMRTDGYGRCHRCHEQIPYKRLLLKPDTLFCVPCLTLIEQGVARN